MTHLLCGPFRVVAFAGLIQVRFIMVSAPEDLTKLRPIILLWWGIFY